MKKEIPIFFAVDDTYVPYLAVALRSMIKHVSKDNKYIIKILYTNISENNQKRILKYKNNNFDIEFVNISEKLNSTKEQLYTRDYFSMATYYRLYIPELYPEYDKAIYIDCDVVLLDDIANLYNIDIEDNLVIATPDGAVEMVDLFKDYVEKVVGMKSYKNYFNAGVIVMNLKEMRKFNFFEKFTYLLKTITFKVAQDQDYLNRLCKGRVKIIDNSWDRMPLVDGTLPKEKLHLVHFNMSDKPWIKDNVKYEEYFWENAKETEFYNEILEYKNNYPESKKIESEQMGIKLIELAAYESSCVGDDR